MRTTFDSENVMLTSLLLLAPLALAGGSRDRAEDSRDRNEDARDHREDRADARHDGGTADRREDARDRDEDVRDRREDVRDRHDHGRPRGHAAAYAPRYTPAYGPRRGPPPRRTVVVHRAPPPPPRAAPARVAAEPTHDFVLSVDAFEAVNGMADVTGEFSVGRKAGFVIEGGLGANEEGLRYTLGTALRGYISGDFDGGLYLAMGADYGNARAFAPTSNGFSIGPSIGAKHTFDVPLTVQASVGASAVFTDAYHGVLPTVSVGLGWAF